MVHHILPMQYAILLCYILANLSQYHSVYYMLFSIKYYII